MYSSNILSNPEEISIKELLSFLILHAINIMFATNKMNIFFIIHYFMRSNGF